jgi:hypothetical protein
VPLQASSLQLRACLPAHVRCLEFVEASVDVLPVCGVPGYWDAAGIVASFGPRVVHHASRRDRGWSRSHCTTALCRHRKMNHDPCAVPSTRSKCRKCDKTFARFAHMQRHEESNHSATSNRWKCEYCTKSYTRRSALPAPPSMAAFLPLILTYVP